MDKAKAIKHLTSLCQLDIDAVSAYEEAIERIDVDDVREQLVLFRQDHERHIRDLSAFLVQYGAPAPKLKPDLKGYLLEGMTALRSSIGTQGALKAMRINEGLTNRRYRDASADDFEPELGRLIRANYEDEQRHLKYIEQVIDARVWERRHVA